MTKLIDEIETFMALTGVSARDVGWFSMRDPNLVGAIRRGRSPREETAEKVRAWMNDFLHRHRVIDLDKEDAG